MLGLMFYLILIASIFTWVLPRVSGIAVRQGFSTVVSLTLLFWLFNTTLLSLVVLPVLQFAAAVQGAVTSFLVLLLALFFAVMAPTVVLILLDDMYPHLISVSTVPTWRPALTGGLVLVLAQLIVLGTTS